MAARSTAQTTARHTRMLPRMLRWRPSCSASLPPPCLSSSLTELNDNMYGRMNRALADGCQLVLRNLLPPTDGEEHDEDRANHAGTLTGNSLHRHFAGYLRLSQPREPDSMPTCTRLLHVAAVPPPRPLHSTARRVHACVSERPRQRQLERISPIEVPELATAGGLQGSTRRTRPTACTSPWPGRLVRTVGP